MYADHRHALLVVLQGMDAAGKDGTIRHVMAGFNPQGCRVTAFKRPSVEEAEHDFLWRIPPAGPPKGDIAIFNPAHYEDVPPPGREPRPPDGGVARVAEPRGRGPGR